MKRLAAAVLTGLALAACSSSGSSGPVASFSAPPSPAPATYTTQAEAVTAACAAFDIFTADLARLTPEGSQVRLNDDAGKVLAPLIHVSVPLDTAGQAMLDDVTTFVGHVGSLSFPATGTPIDPEITAVSDDCAAS